LIKAATLKTQDDFEVIKNTVGNKPKIGTKLKKSASMKLKRSWFPAFRLGGNSHQVQVTPRPPPTSSTSSANQPGQPSVLENPYQAGNSSSSKNSIVRRSSSRLNVNSSVALNPSADDYGATGTPILLSVRKRSTSDSGYSGEDTCCDSPIVTGGAGLHQQNSAKTTTTTNKNSKSSSNSNHGLSFLRLFHKSSATLQLQHPKAGELAPSLKPYKGTVMTSMDHQRKKKEFLKRKLPLVPMASSSLSSLNTLANERDAVVSSAMVHAHKNSCSSNVHPLRSCNQVHHSSSNSVISSSGEDSTTTTESATSATTSRGCSSSSNYDSGAFSRSSSPTDNTGHANGNPHNVSSLSMSRLALTEPLVAPRLVLAACRGEWSDTVKEIAEQALHYEEVEVKAGIAKHQKLHQLQQMQHRKKARARSMSAVRNADEDQITVSVGANTKLTIGSPESPALAEASGSGSNSRLSNLRRSRSGLPVLGTTALRPSPVKPIRSSTATNIRTKISTVYLAEPTSNNSDLSEKAEKRSKKPQSSSSLIQVSNSVSGGTASVINRSSSIVTVMGSKPPGIKCDCNERVTVNGQHHCTKHITIRDLNTKQCFSTTEAPPTGGVATSTTVPVVDRSTNTTPINVLCNQMDKYHHQQPSSIIEI